MGHEPTQGERLLLDLWTAHRDGDLDGMLRHLDPGVQWRPLARPGRSTYTGHAGIAEMLEDIESFQGPTRIDLQEVSEVATGKVVGHMVIHRVGPDGASLASIEAWMTMLVRDGLVYDVETAAHDPVTRDMHAPP